MLFFQDALIIQNITSVHFKNYNREYKLEFIEEELLAEGMVALL